MAGSTTGVPMSPGQGGYQTATPPPYYTTTYATTSYYTEVAQLGLQFKPPRIQIITPQLVLLPELHYQSAEYYTEAPEYYTTEAPTETTTKAVEYYTGAPKYDRGQSSELHRHPTWQPRSFE
jgi:hypothetical protein